MEGVIGKGTLHFALKVYNVLAENRDENMFFSPFSITAVLSMLHLAAKEETAWEIKQCLGYESPSNVGNHMGLSGIVQIINETKGQVTLEAVNKLFADKSFPLIEDFVKILKEAYLAETDKVDFKQNPEQCRLKINEWAESQTRGKITDLLPSGTIDSQTKFVLANALYFKGDWKEKFQVKDTRRLKFHVAEGKEAPVDLMFRSGKYNIAFDHELRMQAVEIPYLGEEVTMIICLPTDRFGLETMIEKLSKKIVTGLTFSLEKLELLLPKMKLEQRIDLKEVLQKMGVRKVFEESQANLKSLSPANGLFVSDMIQKACVEVNEEGSEAAAATAAVIMKRSMAMPIRVTCDHPFLFFFVHKPSKTMLFMGRYTSPE